MIFVLNFDVSRIANWLFCIRHKKKIIDISYFSNDMNEETLTISSMAINNLNFAYNVCIQLGLLFFFSTICQAAKNKSITSLNALQKHTHSVNVLLDLTIKYILSISIGAKTIARDRAQRECSMYDLFCSTWTDTNELWPVALCCSSLCGVREQQLSCVLLGILFLLFSFSCTRELWTDEQVQVGNCDLLLALWVMIRRVWPWSIGSNHVQWTDCIFPICENLKQREIVITSYFISFSR